MHHSIILAVAAVVIVAWLLLTVYGARPKRPDAGGRQLTPMSADERRFRNVFAMMGEDRRQSLITYYAQKHECSREEAMRYAVEERAIDEDRW
jgi:hypothetical protein